MCRRPQGGKRSWLDAKLMANPRVTEMENQEEVRGVLQNTVRGVWLSFLNPRVCSFAAGSGCRVVLASKQVLVSLLSQQLVCPQLQS